MIVVVTVKVYCFWAVVSWAPPHSNGIPLSARVICFCSLQSAPAVRHGIVPTIRVEFLVTLGKKEAFLSEIIYINGAAALRHVLHRTLDVGGRGAGHGEADGPAVERKTSTSEISTRMTHSHPH